jgi:DinB family
MWCSLKREEDIVELTRFFAGQLDREAAISRRVLQHVPEGMEDWRPHAKSMPLGYLASLVATMPSWVGMAIDRDELDLNPAGGTPPPRQTWKSTADLQRMHDEAVEGARKALGASNDAHLATPWKLLVAGHVVMTSPRDVVIADAFTHLAHHRGQLTVYLRLNEKPVPSVYGPSADDRTFGG